MLLQLNRIQLDTPINQTGECIVLAELILPRNSIARKTALKDVRLTKGTRSFAREAFYEKALFKEKVEGLFGLKVSITRPLKHPELNQFLRQLLATGIESLPDLTLLSSIRPPLLGEVIEEAGDQLADRVAEESPDFIAVGGIDLDSETLAVGEIAVALKLTERLRVSDLPPGPKSREKRRQSAKTYKKGSVVGEIRFNLTI